MAIELQASLPRAFSAGTAVEIELSQRSLVWCAGKTLSAQADGARVMLASASVVLLPLGERLTLSSGGRGAYAVVSFGDSDSTDTLSDYNAKTAAAFSGRAGFIRCDPDLSALFLLACRAIAGETHAAEPLFAALLARLFPRPMDAAPDEPAASHQSELVERVKRIVARGYADKVTLEGTARDLYVNASYLSTLFKRKTGLSFRQYLCRYRIAKAQELLLQTSDMVEDVATATGFGSTAYFISVFREQCGVTPNVYRAEARRRRFGKQMHLITN